MSSLDTLVGYLKKDKFKNMNMFYKGKKLNLLLRKGVYPYDYVDSLEKSNRTCLPPKEFFNKLNYTLTPVTNYKYAQEVWKTLKFKTMREY